MAIFTVRATLAPQWQPTSAAEITAADLGRVIAGGIVRGFFPAPSEYDVMIELWRERHDIVLQDVIAGAEHLGLRVVEAAIVRWATAVAEAALAGMIVGALGATAAKDPRIALVTASTGAVIGAYLGQFIHYEAERYLAHPDQFGAWQLAAIALPAPRQVRFAVA
jgi:hypothetical protein